MYSYAAGSPGTFGHLGSMSAAAPLVPVIQRALSLPVAHSVRGTLSSALAAASSGNDGQARSLYGQAAFQSKTLGVALPPLPAPLSSASSTTADVASGVASVADSITAALKNAFATPAHPTPAQQGGVVPETIPGQAAVTGWVPQHAVRDAGAVLQRQIGPLKTWQWGVAVGGVVVAASIISKVAKFALIGGALAGGALLAGKAGGVIR